MSKTTAAFANLGILLVNHDTATFSAFGKRFSDLEDLWGGLITPVGSDTFHRSSDLIEEIKEVQNLLTREYLGGNVHRTHPKLVSDVLLDAYRNFFVSSNGAGDLTDLPL